MKREVTEFDFRSPSFRDAKVEDYEFREDGGLVRKDRWEQAVRSIASTLDFTARGGWEIDIVAAKVEELKKARAPVFLSWTVRDLHEHLHELGWRNTCDEQSSNLAEWWESVT